MHLPTQLKLPVAQGRPSQHKAFCADAWAGPILTIQNHNWKVAAIIAQNIILSQCLQLSSLRCFLGHGTIPRSHNLQAFYTCSVSASTKTATFTNLLPRDVLYTERVKSDGTATGTSRFVNSLGRDTHTYTQSSNLQPSCSLAVLEAKYEIPDSPMVNLTHGETSHGYKEGFPGKSV